MIWQKLKYGTMVAAGIAVTGTAIFYSTTRNTVEAIDMLELFQGAQERLWATQTKLGTNGIAVVTNVTDKYVVTNKTWVSNWWNAVSNRYERTNINYYVWNGYLTNIYNTTGIVGTIWTEGPATLLSPISFKTYYWTPNGNRFIWGIYQTYAIYTDHYGYWYDPEGSYAWWKREYLEDVYDYYTNTAGYGLVLVQRGQMAGDMNSWADYSVNVHAGSSYIAEGYNGQILIWSKGGDAIWKNTITNVDDPYFPFCAIVTNVYPTNLMLTPDKLRSADIMNVEAVSNSVDWIVSHKMFREITQKIYDMINEVNVGDLVGFGPNVYVDNTKTNSDGSFSYITNDFPYVTPTSIWTRLNIGHLFTNWQSDPDITNVLFTDQYAYMSGESTIRYYTNYTICTNELFERFKVLAELKMTHKNGCFYGDGLSGNFTWYAGTSTVSWADAKSIAESQFNTFTVTNWVTNVFPFTGTIPYGTWGRYVGGKWIAQAFVCEYNIGTGELNTNITKSADCYVKARKFDIIYYQNPVPTWVTPSSIEWTYDDNGYGYVTNVYKRETAGSSVGTNSYFSTSATIGGATFPTWCDDPTATPTKFKARGFIITNVPQVILNWNFEHCTNSL